jgi:hypothetical protein
VSNAAGYAGGPVTDLGDETWESLRATNVDAFFDLAEHVLPHLARSGGNLVAISSVSGDRGDWGQAAYNATNASGPDVVGRAQRTRGFDRGGDSRAHIGSDPRGAHAADGTPDTGPQVISG